MRRHIIIGLSGKKGSGKSTCTRFLTRNKDTLFGVHQYPDGSPTGSASIARLATFPMAGPLKKVCVEVLGLAPEQVYGTNEQKDSLTRYRWEDLPHYHQVQTQAFKSVIQKYGPIVGDWPRDVSLPAGQMTARQVMQHIGGMFRMMYRDVWAEACVRSILASNMRVALIDDIRFPNEVELVQQAGGVVYRLTRAVDTTDEHESERALDREVYNWEQFDGVIDNAAIGPVETCKLLLLKLYEDGLIPNAVKLCPCCDGIDPDELNYMEDR